jgi:hypothetical protein
MSALKFLNLKNFHPSNKANQRALFIAEEKQKEFVEQEKTARLELEVENELFNKKIQDEEERKKIQKNLDSFRNKKNKLNGLVMKNEKEGKEIIIPEVSLEKIDNSGKRKRRKKKKNEIDKEDRLPLSFMYVAPPGKNIL